jgi:hypothetical protein
MRTHLSLLAFPLLATSLLAACDGGADLDAKYTAATQQQRVAAVGAARGDLATGSMFLGTLLAALPTSPACPTISKSGKDVTIKGGCSDDDTRYDGSLIIKGLDLTKPDDKALEGTVSFDWNKFTVTAGGKKTVIDGSITFEGKGGKGTIHTDLSVEAGGQVVSVDSGSTCTDKACTVDAGSTVTVKGVGTGEIKGDFTQSDDDVWSGALELHGKETLRVDFSKVKTPGCYEATVEGKAVDAVCLDAPKSQSKSSSLAALVDRLR